MTDKSYTEFSSPKEIVNNDALRRKEKIELLADWKQDMNRLLESTEENMPPHNYNSMKDGAMLRAIEHALRSISDRKVTTEHFAR